MSDDNWLDDIADTLNQDDTDSLSFDDDVTFSDSVEPRCPVILLLDTSASMQGQRIQELNAGLVQFAQDIKNHSLASVRVEIAIITFGGKVKVVSDTGAFDAEDAFTLAYRFNAPTLSAQGRTPMGAAVNIGLKLIRDRKAIYKRNAIDHYRPWMFIITDGLPTDDWEKAAELVRNEEERKGLLSFGIGVQDANMEVLSQFSNRQAMKLRGLDFVELFGWLSMSVQAVSMSHPGESIALPPLTWADIDL